MNMRYQWIIVSLLWVSHAAYYLNFMAVGTLAPLIQRDLALSLTEVGFLTSALTGGSMLIQIPSGTLADKIGARWVMTLGLSVVSIASFLVFLCGRFSFMFVLLLVAGMGIGANQTPATKGIVMWFPPRGRATGMGIKQTGVSMAGIVAPYLLPAAAIHFHSWRYSYLLASLMAGIAAILMVFLYRDPPICAPVLSASDKTSLRSFAALLTDIDFVYICGAGIFLMAAQFIFSTYFMLYASEVWRLPIKQCGGLLSLAYVSGAAGRIGWSLLSDYVFRAKRDRVIIILAVFGILCSIIILAADILPLSLIYAAAICLGFSVLGWNAIYYTAVGEFPPRSMTGKAVGISLVITNVGAILGPPAFGYLRDFTGSYTWGWLLASLCLCGVVLLIRLKKKERMTQE